MTKIIMFPRGKTFIAATIIKTVLEPLDNSDKHQVVFFVQDKAGRRYRVPKSQVAVMGSKPKEKKKGRGRKCKKSKIAI